MVAHLAVRCNCTTTRTPTHMQALPFKCVNAHDIAYNLIYRIFLQTMRALSDINPAKLLSHEWRVASA